jgi:hypothetical protein
MKFYVLRLVDWLPNAAADILFFLQTSITNYLRHVKKPGRNFKLLVYFTAAHQRK